MSGFHAQERTFTCREAVAVLLRLNGVHIHGSPRNPAALYGLRQRCQVHHLPSASVYEVAAREWDTPVRCSSSPDAAALKMRNPTCSGSTYGIKNSEGPLRLQVQSTYAARLQIVLLGDTATHIFLIPSQKLLGKT